MPFSSPVCPRKRTSGGRPRHVCFVPEADMTPCPGDRHSANAARTRGRALSGKKNAPSMIGGANFWSDGLRGNRHIASFKSLAARNSTFLLAFFFIHSPTATYTPLPAYTLH